VIAVISDIHGNLEALQAVLERCEQLGVDDYICLGDVVGYGPDPVAVTEIAMKRFRITLLGNHEEALVTGKHRFNPYAAQAIDWTRNQLKGAGSGRFSRLLGSERPDFMEWYRKRMPFELDGTRLLVHGSIYDPVHDYVDEPENPVEADRMIHTLERDFSGFDLCFAGHNHVPFIATKMGTFFPHEGHPTFRLPEGHKAYVCVGSVGQPRDRDWRASFATVDGEAITYHRIPYDIERTQRKIRDAGLHEFLAERLEFGC
jgi:predicted phosphodiesterase